MEAQNHFRSHNTARGKSEILQVRSFAGIDDDITGKSVVLQETPSNSFQTVDMWPRSLSDFLSDRCGRTVTLEYSLPNGTFVRKRGVLRVAGTGFVGIVPMNTPDLLLVDLSSVKAVVISGGAGSS